MSEAKTLILKNMEDLIYVLFLLNATYILVLIGAVISIIAFMNVKSTFSRYSRNNYRTNMTGAQAASEILRAAGITDVRIERVSGNVTDHYSPKEGVLRLSDSVYDVNTVAAVGVAAHECGHAMQYDQDYFPIKIRSVVIPLANIGSSLSWPVILLGLIFGATGLMQIGVLLFSLVVIFQLLTLPVEFDASARALRTLRDRNMLAGRELSGARQVLTAAALTYVAALVTSVLQLLRLVLITRRND